MTETLDHIRRPLLPWRPDEGLTECGKRAVDVASVISGEAAIRKWRQQGQQRAALSTCMTCIQTLERHWGASGGRRGSPDPPTWETDPVGILARYVERVRWSGRDTDPLNVELRALALLVAEHRDEFDATVAALLGAVDLSARRAQRRRG